MNEIEKLDLNSLNLKNKKIQEFKAIFPEVFSDGKIDIQALEREFGEWKEVDKERYGLTWFGKSNCIRVIQQPSIGTLRPSVADSENFNESENIFIEGDNLEVLKLLQKSYYGKVKLIYIDPPYNTSGDFIYPDNYQEGLQEYLKKTNQVDGKGLRLEANLDSDGRRHTKWLNMMYSRVKLAKNLLKQDGVILVSINDVEVANLRLLLNEIFGEENFLCQFIWNNDGNVDQQSKIKGVHEYILAYVNNSELFKAPKVIDPNIEETSKLFNDQIENSITKNGPANPPSRVVLPAGFPANFEEGSIEPRFDKFPHVHSKISVSNFALENPATLESGWSSKNLLELYIKNGCQPILDSEGKETVFALTSTGAIYVYKKRSDNQGHVLSVIRNVGTTKQNSNMLAAWGVNFSYPKPVFLIQYLVDIFTEKDSNDIVLDFFAGSGTTGHAILRANLSDGGNRKFVLVQLPEATDIPDCPTIAAITRKRLSASIKNEVAKNGGLNVANSLLGYRSFRLDSSNFSLWSGNQTSESINESLKLFAENIDQSRSSDDIFFEILLKAGFDLSSKFERLKIADKEVYSVEDNALLICLDKNLNIEVIEKMLELNPFQIICLDDGFKGDDQLKVNAVQTIKSRQENEETKTVFRVV